METLKVKVWDLPIRAFHWTSVISFLAAWITSESETYRNIHFFCGYYLLSIMSLRIIYGFIGSKYARFCNFIKPKEVIPYIKNIKISHYIGHNPLGAIGIILLILGTLGTTIAGHYLSYDDTELLSEIHETLANLTMTVVAIHVLGVLISSKVHKENLVKSMLTGNKHTTEKEVTSVKNNPILAVFALLLSTAFAYYMM